MKTGKYRAMFILKVASILDKYEIPYAIVGGNAVCLHGAVRGTIDIDLITVWTLENLTSINAALKEIGLIPKLPITPKQLFQLKDEYLKNKNMLAWNFINPNKPMEQVDVIITIDCAEVSTQKFKLNGQTLSVISKKDLIAMKKASGREQDIEDIRALENIK